MHPHQPTTVGGLPVRAVLLAVLVIGLLILGTTYLFVGGGRIPSDEDGNPYFGGVGPCPRATMTDDC